MRVLLQWLLALFLQNPPPPPPTNLAPLEAGAASFALAASRGRLPEVLVFAGGRYAGALCAADVLQGRLVLQDYFDSDHPAKFVALAAISRAACSRGLSVSRNMRLRLGGLYAPRGLSGRLADQAFSLDAFLREPLLSKGFRAHLEACWRDRASIRLSVRWWDDLHGPAAVIQRRWRAASADPANPIGHRRIWRAFSAT